MTTTIHETKRLAKDFIAGLEQNGAGNMPTDAASSLEEVLDRIIGEWEGEADRRAKEARNEGYEKGQEEEAEARDTSREGLW